ncbi:MAG TPA: response regulator, partial [Cellvibrionaceae bacterium]
SLRFSISDFGEGLSSAQLDQLRRALSDNADTDQRDKTQGFGLQICKLLVRLMNGTLHIASSKNQGTTLSFTADFEKSHIGTRAIQHTTLACQSMRLLIVDDNKLAREILTKSAIKLIHNIDTASDAHIALKKIHDAEQQNAPYDLILLDYKMPLKTGLEAAREIKTSAEINNKPSIFLVSSFHRDEIFSDHQDSNYVDDFLSKPVSESRLFDAICRAFPEVAISQPMPQSDDFEQLRGLCVLLVEDNPVNQTVAAGILQKKGVEVVSVDNGQEALNALFTMPERFDVIFMDIEMPIMDGVTATREIRKQPRFDKLPIIAVTAQAMPGDRENCIEAGMNDYISKPINPTALYQLLSDLIDRQKQTFST